MIYMKKFVCLALSLVCSVAAFSQSAKQIVSQMQEYVKAHESEGVSYTEQTGLLYVHSYKTTYSSDSGNGVFPLSNVETTADTRETNLTNSKLAVLGRKSRTESAKETVYYDMNIDKKWTVMTEKKEINHDFVNTGDLHSFANNYMWLDYIVPAYRYKITEETDDSWTITGKRKLITKYLGTQKSIKLVVRKGTCQPVSVTLYQKIDGEPFDAIEITKKKDIHFGVTEQQVTFNPENYPGYEITEFGL